MPSTLAPNRLSNSSRRALSPEARPPWVGEVTLSQELRTARSPRAHVLVGYQSADCELGLDVSFSHEHLSHFCYVSVKIVAGFGVAIGPSGRGVPRSRLARPSMVSPPTPCWFPRRPRGHDGSQCQHQTGQAASGLLSLQGLQLAKERFQDLRTGDQEFATARATRRMQPDEVSITLAASRPDGDSFIASNRCRNSRPNPSRCRDGGPAGPPLGSLRATDSIARWPHDSPAASPAWPPVARGRFSSTPPVDDLTAPHSSARVGRALAEHHRAHRSGAAQIHEPGFGTKRRPHAARQGRLLQLRLGLAELGHEPGPPRSPSSSPQQVRPLVSHVASGDVCG